MSRYHFIAMGGAVMHNLALELQANGHFVQGSDDEIFDPAKSRLAAAGLLPEAFGWFPEKLNTPLDAVILGMHAKPDNPELKRAQELGLTIYSFPAFIHHHSTNKTRLVIAGSHGKTTSTAMLMHILRKSQKEFDYLVGSLIDGYDRMVKLSDAPLMVIEGDEYLTSPIDLTPKFFHYHPHAAMITGVAWDHINVFPTFENYVSQFDAFIQTVQGECFTFGEDTELQQLADKNAKCKPYRAPEYVNNSDGVTVSVNGHKFNLPFFGKHNVENAAGVVLLAQTVGISVEDSWRALQDFPGTSKRLERIFQSENLTVYRDFAHAPSKVAATVKAVREQYPQHHFIAAFELHTYSSLMPEFMAQYQGTLNAANQALVLFDPHVFELKRMPIPTKETVESRLGNVTAFTSAQELKQNVEAGINPEVPTVVLWMSSGNFGGVNLH
jgi:UDP-N-acetylmuramate: L-alanyl-gamma-D-glutamyl-meso-diaminopimelate ligase